jgi:hypothetical protein
VGFSDDGDEALEIVMEHELMSAIEQGCVPGVCNFQCSLCPVSEPMDQIYAVFDCSVSASDVCQWPGVELLTYHGNVHKCCVRHTPHN